MIIQSCCASSRLKKCAERNALALDPQPQRDYGSRSSSRKTSLDDKTNEFQLVDCSNENLGTVPEFVIENSNVIEHLILDGNLFTEQSLEELPRFERLKTLSLNSNKVKNIGIFLQLLQRKCPKLRFLSLIGNPGWPHPIKNDNLDLYFTYACAAAKFLPSLCFLDTIALNANGCRRSHDKPHGGACGRGYIPQATVSLTHPCKIV